MSNKSCEDCKWDKKGIFCLQGHVRRIKYVDLNALGHINLENCHAWGEKPERCWCEKVKNTMIFKGLDGGGFEINPSKASFCPVCGKKL